MTVLFRRDMWHETQCTKGWNNHPRDSIPRNVNEWIVSGPHFYVATPFNKTPNEGCQAQQDYSDIDLTTIPDDYLPRTNYVPACSPEEYRRRIPKWNGKPIHRNSTGIFIEKC